MERFRLETGARLISLATNYRSRSEILSAASKLICFNQERIDKALVSIRGPGGTVTSMRYSSRPLEAEAAIEKIWSDVTPFPDDSWFNYTVPAGKWAVIARNRRTLDCVEEALHARHIRYIRPPSESIWTRQPFVFFIGLLRAIQTGDANGIDQALHFAGLIQDHLDLVHDAMQPDLWKLLDGQVPPLAFLPDDVVKTLKTFSSLAAGWRSLARKGNYDLAISGIAEWFAGRISNEDERELFNTLVNSVRNLNGSLTQRVNFLTLPDNKHKDSSGVALMTMHGSKGLEFENVWIVAAEDGVIPSPKNHVYDEERRLMYVGMTRAKDHLFLSSRVTVAPSPFVIEAGYDPRSVTS